MMDAVVGLLAMLVCVIVMREVTLWACPWAVRIVEGVFKSVWRLVVKVVWTTPSRSIGVGKTLLLWFAVVHVITTVIKLTTGAFADLPAVLVFWVIIAGWWFLLKWLGERRFRPRRLPERTRRRDPRWRP